MVKNKYEKLNYQKCNLQKYHMKINKMTCLEVVCFYFLDTLQGQGALNTYFHVMEILQKRTQNIDNVYYGRIN